MIIIQAIMYPGKPRQFIAILGWLCLYSSSIGAVCKKMATNRYTLGAHFISSFCPVQMLNLKEPLVDEMGFVYEKEAIFDWLSKQQGDGRIPVKAPIAGEPPLMTPLPPNNSPCVSTV